VRARTERLKRVGLSSPKIRALKAIARAVIRGELALATLCDLSAEDAHAALTAIHGIGPWTADIYLLSCLGHVDSWPAGDLALQEAARVAFGLDTRPTAKDMVALAEAWRPWRSVAARVLWTYYRFVKGREGAPVLPRKPQGEPKRGVNGRRA
jgi:DNA-3-methyladenine glycosylase II